MAKKYDCDECRAPFTATNRCVCDELIEVDAGRLATLERVVEIARTIHSMEYLAAGMNEELGEALKLLGKDKEDE